MAYNGRRGPNVSEYIANLNAIPSAQDLQSAQEFNLEDDLAMFTNTNFFDFDMGPNEGDLLGAGAGAAGVEAPAQTTEGSTMKPVDFGLQGDFSFPEFSNFGPPPSFPERNAHQPAPINTSQPEHPSSSSTSSPATALATPVSGEKRKAESISQASPAADFEEASRLAAEEDKRRRNTAASARFRVKKKQREQALEKSSKEMSDKVAGLEGRINQLETENKWLKNLITEKNDDKEDIAQLWKKFNQETSADRKGSERKDGVGTKA